MSIEPKDYSALASPDASDVAAVTSARTLPPPVRRTPLSWVWHELKGAPLSALFGLAVIAIYAFVAIFAPLLAPHSEWAVVGNQYEPWSRQFIFGTDQLGRDMLSRLIYGARNTVGIAVLTTTLSFVIGGALGLLAAILGGW